jgi:RimJ/RimL family protein N-acetyltransferase
MAHPHWPLFDLEVRTPDLTLRYPDDALLAEMLAVAVVGVHDPAFMPFAVPWTRHTSPQLEHEALRFHWQNRADTRPAAFRIPLAVIVDGEVIGASELVAVDFPILRRFETGSWLGREHQGRGIGKRMRCATLALGFDGLGGELATTTAWHDNGPSLGVTRSLGYTPQGRRRESREGTATELLAFDMEPETFAAIRPPEIEFSGLDAVRSFLEL